MADTRVARIARIDDAIASHRSQYINDYCRGHLVDASRLAEAARHAAEVDRLLDLRNRVERGWPKTIVAP